MTRDEIIKLAREAAARHGHTLKDQPSPETIEFIVELVAIAAAAEREACYQIALTIGDDDAGCRHTDEVARRIRARGNT